MLSPFKIKFSYTFQETEECNVVNNCDPNADCQYDRRTGRYSCECRPGYDGDGIRCQLICK